jgi:acetyl-CoA carboxylase carboxyl transferase subunit alpha
MKRQKLVDDIIPEPLGGAHYDRDHFITVEQYIMKAFNELKDLSTKDLIDQRMDKYSKMGEYKVKSLSLKKSVVYK